MFLKPAPQDLNTRLDIYLSKKIPDISRSQIKKLIDNGSVLINNLTAKSSSKLKEADIVSINIPEPIHIEAKPEDIPLNILYEDKSIIVVNKSAGMVVHAGSGNAEKTFVNALLHHCKDLSGIGGALRPGIVHRLDKDTSGTIVAAKNDNVHRALALQFKEHTVKKRYAALVCGVVKADSGTIALPIGRHISHRQRFSVKTRRGRMAVTHYKVVKRFKHFTLLEVEIETGRTHQIRVHMAHMRHPIAGDSVYGKKGMPSSLSKETISAVKGLTRQALHSSVLGFIHPDTGKYIEFFSPLPDDMEQVIKTLEKTDINCRV